MFIDNLNDIYFISNHIHQILIILAQPSQQSTYLNHSPSISMDQAQHNIKKLLTNYLQQTNPTPHIHITLTIPYWLNGILIGKHYEEIHTSQTHINK